MYTRNILNAQQAVNYLRSKFPNVEFETKQIIDVKDMSGYSILVNATPIGMRGYSMDQSPVEYETMKTLDETTIVYDIVYNPIETKFLQYAKQCNLKVVEGLDMLIYQAEGAIKIWTGKTPDIQTMNIAALRAL